MKIALSLAILTSLFCSTISYADVTAPEQGTVQVTVVDENGAVVNEAPVYIYGAKRSQFVRGADVPGSTTFTMKDPKLKATWTYNVSAPGAAADPNATPAPEAAPAQ